MKWLKVTAFSILKIIHLELHFVKMDKDIIERLIVSLINNVMVMKD